MKKSIMFKIGMKIEFNNDGDICKVVGRRQLRKRYFILYKSIKTGKDYSNTRDTLIEAYNRGILKLKE